MLWQPNQWEIYMFKQIIGALLCVQFVCALPAAGAQAVHGSATESTLASSVSLVREAQFNAQLPHLVAQSTRLRLKTLLIAALQDLQSAIKEEHVIPDHQPVQAKAVRTLTMWCYDIGRYAYRDVAPDRRAA